VRGWRSCSVLVPLLQLGLLLVPGTKCCSTHLCSQAYALMRAIMVAAYSSARRCLL
jgi:hypothetical protein